MDRKNQHKLFGDSAAGYRMRKLARDIILEHQDYKCAGCGMKLRAVRSTERDGAHLDHDHVTGQIRGVLCGSCNYTLGHAKDSSAVLRRLADYLDADGVAFLWPRVTPDRPAPADTYFAGTSDEHSPQDWQ